MDNLKELMKDIMDKGQVRPTRTGNVRSVWNRELAWDLSEGFPATTSKKLAWQSVVGELLWFLSGSSSICDLKHYTFNDPASDKKTIWCDDAKRWSPDFPDDVGALYGTQWREYHYSGVDQIANLIKSLTETPYDRDHIVINYNPIAKHYNEQALKACHVMFQCYVRDGKLSLHWVQRSVDTFLGLPFNIASYALLTHLLAKWCGLEVGQLSCTLLDVHLYENHKDAVNTFLNNPSHPLPTLQLPDGCDSLDDVLKLTAKDFKDSLLKYKHEGAVKAPLSVGE